MIGSIILSEDSDCVAHHKRCSTSIHLSLGVSETIKSQIMEIQMTSIPATKSDSAQPRRPGMSRASKVRWAVAVFCAFGLAINYIDRSAISVSLPFMSQDFSLTPTEKGLILSAFSWSYALMQIPA